MNAARGGRRPGHRKVRKPSPKFRGGPVPSTGCPFAGLVLIVPGLVVAWTLTQFAGWLISLPLAAVLGP